MTVSVDSLARSARAGTGGDALTHLRLLLVEDDDSLALALNDAFADEGYEVVHVGNGLEALAVTEDHEFDLVVLDLMLPKMGGLEVFRRWQHSGFDVPVIVLTARSSELDRVLGLRLGADDYVTKPFSVIELLARAEAVLRRARPKASEGKHEPRIERVRFGIAEVDFLTYEARRAGRRVSLSPREVELLRYLVEHRGSVVSRDVLLDRVWGYRATPCTRTVDTHVARLRRKLEHDPPRPKHLLTVHGVGYRFVG